MIQSFCFAGKNCGEFGIILEKAHRKLIPGKRQAPLVIAGRDGSINAGIGDVYDDILISCECAYAASTMELLRHNARDAALWLSKKGELEFTDEPGKFYSAELSGEIALETEFRVGRFTLEFRCFPFAQSLPNQENFIITRFGQELELNVSGTAPAPCRITIKNTGTTLITNIRLTHKKEV